jgi:hypothetical protein
MGSPLDDALSDIDAGQRASRRQQQASAERAAAERQSFQELVDDFLRRMHAAGDPGTDWEIKVGVFRKVRGWSLTYEVGDAWRKVPVRVDGLVPNIGQHTQPADARYVRPIDSQYEMKDSHLTKLAKSMAEVMRRNGVS